MVYFTADTHLGHQNIIRHCNRPFASAEEMGEVLLRNWNTRVTDEDEVYILGDLMYFCKEPEGYLQQIKGRKHLIVGNHDATWMRRMTKHGLDYLHYFQSIQPYLELKLEGRDLVLSHYPIMDWNGMHHGTYHLFGHIHNDVSGAYWPLLWSMERALNAGVDLNGFAPVTFQELEENNQRFRAEHPPVLDAQ
jgi:calcineurin-like phosphoesterase family protein